MFNKPAGITCLSPGLSQLVFPRSQRAYPALEFYQSSPDRSRNMKVNNPSPLQYQKATKYHKQDEQQVNNRYYVR